MKTLKQVLFLFVAITLVVGCDPKEGGGDTTKPKETISLERAHEMYKAYQPRFDSLTKIRGQEDARYGWHSIEFYKNYIAYLEEQSAKVKIKISGLRLYYVAYPNDETAGEHRDYQTYIFVPTYYDEKRGKHIAFDPLHVDEQGNPLPIHDVITRGSANRTGSLSMRLVSTQQTPTASSIANMGEMCKPNCAE